MRKNIHMARFWAATAMLILIFHSETTIQGVKEGIDLCIRTVIPALFPFLVLSGILTSEISQSNGKTAAIFGKLFHIPKGCEGILLTGLLGGYPLGAHSVGQAYHNNQICKKDAQQMLMFCNNAGPAFIFGLAGNLFSTQAAGWILWLIQILSACIVANRFPIRQKDRSWIKEQKDSIGFVGSVNIATRSMANICAWIILFRMLITCLDTWGLMILPVSVRVTIYGLIELSNGCISLSFIQNEMMRFILCAGFLGFGGLCVTMQTSSVIYDLGIQHYLFGKLIHGIVSCILAYIIAPMLFPDYSTQQHRMMSVCIILGGCISLIFQIYKNNSRNPKTYDV